MGNTWAGNAASISDGADISPDHVSGNAGGAPNMFAAAPQSYAPIPDLFAPPAQQQPFTYVARQQEYMQQPQHFAPQQPLPAVPTQQNFPVNHSQQNPVQVAGEHVMRYRIRWENIIPLIMVVALFGAAVAYGKDFVAQPEKKAVTKPGGSAAVTEEEAGANDAATVAPSARLERANRLKAVVRRQMKAKNYPAVLVALSKLKAMDVWNPSLAAIQKRAVKEQAVAAAISSAQAQFDAGKHTAAYKTLKEAYDRLKDQRLKDFANKLYALANKRSVSGGGPGASPNTPSIMGNGSGPSTTKPPGSTTPPNMGTPPQGTKPPSGPPPQGSSTGDVPPPPPIGGGAGDGPLPPIM